MVLIVNFYASLADVRKVQRFSVLGFSKVILNGKSEEGENIVLSLQDFMV